MTKQLGRGLIFAIVIVVACWGPSVFLAVERKTIFEEGKIRVDINRTATWLPLVDHLLAFADEGRIETYNGDRMIDHHQLDDFEISNLSGMRIEIANGHVNFFEASNSSGEPDYRVEIW